MAFCATCGTQVQDDVKFCPTCGKAVGAAAAPPPPPAQAPYPPQQPYPQQQYAAPQQQYGPAPGGYVDPATDAQQNKTISQSISFLN